MDVLDCWRKSQECPWRLSVQVDSNSGLSCYEVMVKTAESPCHPELWLKHPQQPLSQLFPVLSGMFFSLLHFLCTVANPFVTLFLFTLTFQPDSIWLTHRLQRTAHNHVGLGCIPLISHCLCSRTLMQMNEKALPKMPHKHSRVISLNAKSSSC